MNRILAFLAVLIAGIFTVYFINRYSEKNSRLPIIHPADINPQLVDESLWHKRGNHKVAPFSLINQRGETFTAENVSGKVYVANFFFTTCPTICPAMNSQVKRVYKHFEDWEDVLFLSHTVMPETDSAPQLFYYAERLGINHDKWVFLTGNKEDLYNLARQSYLVAPAIGDSTFASHGEQTDFIHTENLVLIDKQGRIRGLYDGLNQVRVDELIADMERLLRRE